MIFSFSKQQIVSLLLLLVMCISELVGCSLGKEDNADSISNDNEVTEASTTNMIIEYGETIAMENVSLTEEATAFLSRNGNAFTATGVGTANLAVTDGSSIHLTVKPAVVDVVLFTGQSNMVGRATDRNYPVSIPAGYAYEYIKKSNKLVDVKNPVGEKFGNGVNGLNIQVSSGSSMVPRYCELYAETGRKIVAIHAASGGTAIRYFQEGEELYNEIITKAKAALEYLENSDNFEIGRKYYIMYQGETDATDNTSTADYEKFAMTFHNALKSLGFEFGAWLYNGQNASVTTQEQLNTINTAKYNLAKNYADIILASTLPATKRTDMKDNAHFDSTGIRLIAEDTFMHILSFLDQNVDLVDSLEKP